ncbi:MAG: glycerophosphodiester phosphodiesterase [Caulobacter sp.]|nr:glycerophosphodiester phosphodiesterase [Caulobacter sp.]
MIDRRRFAASGLAGLAALAAGPVRARTPGRVPIIIAHRGASGERPEHTLMAYRLAIEVGADFIEPDLVLSRDGHFLCRHENEISGTTDIAARPEFADRKTTKVIDGETLTGWFTEDFTLAELKTLRCRERLPALRPGNAAYDGQQAIPTFAEVVALAKTESKARGRVIGVYPELKHPRHFASVGLPMEQRLAAAVRAEGYNSRKAPIFVQCFEVGPLKTLRGLIDSSLIQLMSDDGGPADLPSVRYGDMLGAAGMKAIAAYADGVGPDKAMVVPTDGERLLAPTTLVGDAHAAGLKVHPWTVRIENYFLPRSLRALPAAVTPEEPRLHGEIDPVFRALFEAGVDGLFTDNPRQGVAARNRFIGARA